MRLLIFLDNLTEDTSFIESYLNFLLSRSLEVLKNEALVSLPFILLLCCDREKTNMAHLTCINMGKLDWQCNASAMHSTVGVYLKVIHLLGCCPVHLLNLHSHTCASNVSS